MRILRRVLRIGVLLTVLAAVAMLIGAAGGGRSGTVDALFPVLVLCGAVGGAVSSIRYGTVRLAVGKDSPDATSFDVATTSWSDLRGMLADVGWAMLLGTVGWIAASIVSGDALAFLVLGSMWLGGYLAVVVAVFLVWMPIAVFVAAFREKKRGGTARGGWLSLAWCLVAVDVVVLLMAAEAVFVPRGADGLARPEGLWQTILFVVVSLILIILSIGWVIFWIGSWDLRPGPRSTRSARPSASTRRSASRRTRR